MKELKEINSLFKKYKLPLWVNWGTLLHMYRDNILDNDIDLASYDLNIPYYKTKYKKILKYLEDKKYSIESKQLGFVVEKNNVKIGIGFHHIDRETNTLTKKMFTLYMDKFFAKKYYHMFMKKNPTNFKYFFFKILGGYQVITVFPIDMICPLKPFEFNGVTFDVPNKTEQYLEYLYGPNWNTPIPEYPKTVNKKNIKYFEGTLPKFYAKCPNCNSKFIEYRHDFDKPFKLVKVKCPYCKKKFKQKVSVRGTILRRI